MIHLLAGQHRPCYSALRRKVLAEQSHYVIDRERPMGIGQFKKGRCNGQKRAIKIVIRGHSLEEGHLPPSHRRHCCPSQYLEAARHGGRMFP